MLRFIPEVGVPGLPAIGEGLKTFRRVNSNQETM